VLRRTYEGQHCSIARALEVVGERWSLLIVRDVFLGFRRFDDLVDSLGVTRSVLSSRLERLVEEGVLSRRRYQRNPERFEYELTERGTDLWPVILALLGWGDRHLQPDGARPRIVEHEGCGGEVAGHMVCERCGQRPEPDDVRAVLGPGNSGSVRRRGVVPELSAEARAEIGESRGEE
jgi:DNA-binding HxlR family transcriptional regulator